MKFGRLTVIKRGENYIKKDGSQLAQWWCLCDCQLELIEEERELCLAIGANLRNGTKKSCGCFQQENRSLSNKKYNNYDLSGEYGVGYTENGEEFYFDLEDYDKIKDYCWYINTNGYVCSVSCGHQIKMHRLVMGVTDKKIYIDHRFHNKKDNRKYNLRLADTSKNQMNKKIMSNNTSGCTGVYWDARNNKWKAQIVKDGKTYSLGRYVELEDAVKARKDAEEKMFGEWSYDNSQAMDYKNPAC